jgi:hypothetical protein
LSAVKPTELPDVCSLPAGARIGSGNRRCPCRFQHQRSNGPAWLRADGGFFPAQRSSCFPWRTIPVACGGGGGQENASFTLPALKSQNIATVHVRTKPRYVRPIAHAKRPRCTISMFAFGQNTLRPACCFATIHRNGPSGSKAGGVGRRLDAPMPVGAETTAGIFLRASGEPLWLRQRS